MGELTIENLGKTYHRREGWNTTRSLKVFEDISMQVADGEFVSIIGTSGCGKSTLLNITAGLDKATAGRTRVAGQEVTGPGLDRGVVFQEFALFPWLTTLDNVAFGLQSKGVPKSERRGIAQKYVDLVGLSGFESYYIHRLSGGMRQRVGLARALAVEPAALLMDEPFGALDAQTRETMQAALSEIWERTKKTILFVTHDIREAVYLSDRVIVLSGRPATISLELIINLDRPRYRRDDEFQKFERELEVAIGH